MTKLRNVFVQELVSGLNFNGASTMKSTTSTPSPDRDPRKVTKRADSIKMGIWASANKSVLNGKTLKQIKAALHEQFNGTMITPGAVEELVEVCGIEVKRFSVGRPLVSGSTAHISDRTRFVARYVLRIIDRLKAELDLQVVDPEERERLFELSRGRYSVEEIAEQMKREDDKPS